ncbi:substrate-binding domain-containing protein [Elioraea sp.]|uniref:molybdate ABC transporter substrate-binding protein n=1 Tax=Elioraea sp. TaxID=2185103 RepID=UPI00307D18A4
MTVPVLLAAGAVKTAVERLLAAPDAWRGARPRVAYGTVGALRDRILTGEPCDATVLSAEAMALLVARGLIDPATVVPLGATGIGLAAGNGVAVGPIDDEAGLVAALRAAPSIAWADPASGATAGRHFAAVLDRLGLAALVRAKSLIVPFGVEAVAACACGKAALAVSQATEIRGVPGVRLVGLLPPPHALVTAYALGAPRASPAAAMIAATLAGPAGRAALAAIGFNEKEPDDGHA